MNIYRYLQSNQLIVILNVKSIIGTSYYSSHYLDGSFLPINQLNIDYGPNNFKVKKNFD